MCDSTLYETERFQRGVLPAYQADPEIQAPLVNTALHCDRNQCPSFKQSAVIQLTRARFRVVTGQNASFSISNRARRRRHSNGGCARESNAKTVRCVERG